MSKKNNKYWAERYDLMKEAQLNKAEKYLIDLDKEYKKAISTIERDISVWYKRFATNNEISLAEAKKLLLSGELEEFRWSVEEYIIYGEENALNGLWIKELENASSRVHISRLESLKIQLQQQVEVLYGNQLDNMDRLARNIYEDGYYHTAFELQRGIGVGWPVASLNTPQVDSVLSKPWAADGINFSKRIWQNRTRLVSELHTNLTQMIVRGEAPDRTIRVLSKRFNVSKSRAGALVMTESAFFSSAAQKDCFKELGVERYEVIETLDAITCEICAGLDGKVFPMSDYAPGSTAPPFHTRCRGCTAPYFDDEEGSRIARGEDGKQYTVPSNMKYPEWHEKHVVNGSIDGIIKSKAKELKIRGKITTTAKTINLEKFTFDDKHINKDRKHNVTRDEAVSYMDNAKFSISRWEGRFINYYSEEGAVFIDRQNKNIRTAFKREEYDHAIEKLMEALRDYEK